MEVATPATNAAVTAAAARELAAVAALAAVEATRSPQPQQQHCFFIKVAKSSATQKEVENKKSRERPKNETRGKKTEAPLFHFLGGFGTVDVVGHVITRSDAGLGTNRFGFGNLDGTGGGGRKRRRRGSSNFNLERYFLF